MKIIERLAFLLAILLLQVTNEDRVGSCPSEANFPRLAIHIESAVAAAGKFLVWRLS
jgi:hypothetical protein